MLQIYTILNIYLQYASEYLYLKVVETFDKKTGLCTSKTGRHKTTGVQWSA